MNTILRTNLPPNRTEKRNGIWLQLLFPFETELLYHIYDYGERVCQIIIQAKGEDDPPVNTMDSDYKKGPNTIILHRFAKTLPVGVDQWYIALRGFIIPHYRIIELKQKIIHGL